MKPLFTRLSLISVSLLIVAGLSWSLAGVGDCSRTKKSFRQYLSSLPTNEPPLILEIAQNVPDYTFDESPESTLLDSIREKADKIEFFSLPLFLDLFKEDLKIYDYEEEYQRRRSSDGVWLYVTYERFKAFNELYETAKWATREEIVECLSAFDELSPKAKAFVFASTLLYMFRSEDPDFIEATPENRRAEPLPSDEKFLFCQIVQDCIVDSDDVPKSVDERKKVRFLADPFSTSAYPEKEFVFERLNGSRNKWEKSFREGAFLLQKFLADQNPLRAFSEKSERDWQSVCDKGSLPVLYAALALETRLNIDAKYLRTEEANDFLIASGIVEKSAQKPKTKRGKAILRFDELTRRELSAMKHFLLFQLCLTMKDSAHYNYGPIQPVMLGRFEAQSLSEIAGQTIVRVPNLEIVGAPNALFTN